MDDAHVRRYLTKDEAWAFDRALRCAVEERAHTTNPDGTPRISYMAGPWQALIVAMREMAAMRVRLADYESQCKHAWKALPTRYDGVVDECIPADKIGDEDARQAAYRSAAWIETAIRDMGGDVERLAALLRTRLHGKGCECVYCEGNRDFRAALDSLGVE